MGLAGIRAMKAEQSNAVGAGSFIRSIAVWGPGLLVMLADTDAGNVVTAAQSGAQWGYRLLPLVLLLIPMLYMVQELTVRLGIYTGRGHGELIRARFGLGCAWVSTLGLAGAVVGSLITEFTGVAGIGELFGLSRSFTLPLAAATLLIIVASGSYKRVERVALFVGLFELAFFAVAWSAHPGLKVLARDAIDLPIGNREFLFMGAAIIGATFNPWMIFYQQSATVEKKLRPSDLVHARLDTCAGAILTQCLTGAVLVAVAAAFAGGGRSSSLSTVGEISGALSPVMGEGVGRIVFSAGVLGASLVAAIVSSLALAWGVGEVAGYRRSLEYRPFDAAWFYGAYAACVLGSGAVVWFASNLVWLNIVAQVLNVFLMPLVIGFLVALAVVSLPQPYRLRGLYLAAIVAVCTIVTALGVLAASGR
jgi:Mn2+/Fe2+ NRAMP family transporter